MTVSILAPGITDATSATLTIAAGESLCLGIYAAADERLPDRARFLIEQQTPGAWNVVGRLSNTERSMLISGPGSYRLRRIAYTGTAFGGFQASA